MVWLVAKNATNVNVHEHLYIFSLLEPFSENMLNLSTEKRKKINFNFSHLNL